MLEFLSDSFNGFVTALDDSEDCTNYLFCPALASTATNYFVSALAIIYSTLCITKIDWPKNAEVSDGDTFDFIVIGAGTAGSVIASRLSEISGWKVLLVEAGGEPPRHTSVPIFMSSTMSSATGEWNFISKYDPRISQGKRGKVNRHAKGKMLGGTGSINGNIYTRGNPENYNNWYNSGNWGWETVLKYYKKMERMEDSTILNDLKAMAYHGTEGWWHINRFHYPLRDVVNGLLNSFKELWIPFTSDLNIPGNERVGIFHGTIKNGKRDSTASANLLLEKTRKNLKIVMNTYVDKIIMHERKLKALGVEVTLQNGDKASFYCNKEVIVSAGTIKTPQILMLSGIGPKLHLKKFNIRTLIDLPVGKNMIDHVYVPLTISGKIENMEQETEQIANSLVEYCSNGTGLLSTNGLSSVMTYLNTNSSNTFPNIQVHSLYLAPNSKFLNNACSTKLDFSEEVCQSLVQYNKDRALYFFIIVLLHPKSRGEVLLRSANAQDTPDIVTNYLSEEQDVENILTAIRRVSKIVNTTYFSSMQSEVCHLKFSQCKNLTFDTDDYWKCLIYNLLGTNYHEIGTVKMGSRYDKTAVVDDRLKIHGSNNIRVIDGSVIPTSLSSNTNAPIAMIAERAFDLIKEDHNIVAT